MKRFVGDFTQEAYDFMQQNADNLWEFTLCRRDDGSTYGTAGQCRKGVETQATREELLEELKSKGANVDDRVGDKLKDLSDEELANVARHVSEIIASRKGRNIGEMDWDTVESLGKNRDRLIEGFKDPSKLTSNLKQVSDKEAEAFYSLLPKNIQQNLNKAGTLSNKQYLQEDGTHGPANEWRGKQLAKRWLEQDGKDLYTGLPLKLTEADLEHIIPHKIGKDRSESLDNFGWINSTTNQRKKDDSMEEFFKKKVDGQVAMGKEKYDKDVYGKARDKAEKSNFLETQSPFYSTNPDKMTEEVIKQFGKKLYYVTREWGVKHGYKQGRASTRYFSDKLIPGTKEQFAQAVVRRWPNMDDKQRRGVVKISEFMQEKLTGGADSKETMSQAKTAMEALGLTF